MAMMTYAQGTKQVAILEVVDKEGKLTYSQKLVLRSNMARAVANTPGYEAYDRSDVDAIMSEHEFQRTGLVSDAEIRKLGEMTGVSLILVTEAVVLGGDKLFVSAKILNVETARVEMMDNVNMDINNMQEGCNSLASRLFGTNAVSSASSRYRISRLRDGCYAYQNMTLDEKAYMHFLQNNCPEAYAQHKKGKLMVDGGWAAFAAGLAIIGTGSGMYIYFKNVVYQQHGWKIYYINELRGNPFFDASTALLIIGPCVTAASVPLLYFGYKTKKKSVDIYNANCVSSSAQTLSLNLTSGRDGLGLAFQF